MRHFILLIAEGNDHSSQNSDGFPKAIINAT